MRSKVVGATLAVAALAGLTAPVADSEIHVTPHQAALVTIQTNPGFCNSVLKGINSAGYEASFLAFEAGYGEDTKPAPAPVFHDVVEICRRRLG